MNREILKELVDRHPKLVNVKDAIGNASEMIIRSFSQGGKLLICGNGGSASDSGHIAGELMKGFEKERPLDEEVKQVLASNYGERGKYLSMKLQKGLPVISLSAHTSLITAVANDADPDLIYAQQVIAYGKESDILLAISTSGNSQNIADAILTAKAMNIAVIGLTGASGGKMKDLCDLLINVPETRTSYVQELHLPVYHAICMIIEDHFFSNHNPKTK
jgi:D-sedoheptulose 7-phosphate isomerase